MIDTCPDCGGIFFDEGEVSQIRARGGNQAFEDLDEMVQPKPEYLHLEENKHRRCPNCTSTMRRYRYMYTSPVFLDSCDSCGGIWIDNGELKKMKEYLDAEKKGKRSRVDFERDEVVATLDALTIEQHAKAERAHWAARALSFYPWL
jgi:Zn-finger nucleic acid-binding protein